MKRNAIVFLEVIFFGVFFRQVWENLGKSPSHPQEFALSCTFGTLHFLFPYRESLYKWLPDRESTWTVSPLLIPDFLSTTLLQVSLTGLARHNVVDQTSGAFPSSHFMWIASLRCLSSSCLHSTPRTCLHSTPSHLFSTIESQGVIVAPLSVCSSLTAVSAGLIRCFVVSPTYCFCTDCHLI